VGLNPPYARTTCCDRGYGRASGRPRVFLRQAQDKLTLRRTETYASCPSPCGCPVAQPSPRSRYGVSCTMRVYRLWKELVARAVFAPGLPGGLSRGNLRSKAHALVALRAGNARKARNARSSINLYPFSLDLLSRFSRRRPWACVLMRLCGFAEQVALPLRRASPVRTRRVSPKPAGTPFPSLHPVSPWRGVRTPRCR